MQRADTALLHICKNFRRRQKNSARTKCPHTRHETHSLVTVKQNFFSFIFMNAIREIAKSR